MIRLKADFNEASGEEIWTSLRLANFLPRGAPSPGEVVELWDGEGISCHATVESVRDPIVFLRLDLSTWKEPAIHNVKAYRSPVDAPSEFDWASSTTGAH